MAYVDELERLWKGAGGEAPLPVHPDRVQVDALRSLSGQELAQALFQQGTALELLREEWKKRADLAKSRAESWSHLQRLRTKAAGLAEAEDLEKQAQTLQSERRLLDATDSVQPLRAQFVKILRTRINAAVTHCLSVHEEEQRKLEAEAAWKNISKPMQLDLMREERILKPDSPALGTEEDILQSLERHSFGYWQALTDAMPQQFGKALARATKYLEPKSQAVRLPRETLRNVEEVDGYLHRLGELLRGKVNQGPVVVE
jgi:hypothetical protein